MGMQIALTGLIIFALAVFLSVLAKMPPKQNQLFSACAITALFAMLSIPIGLIIQIWQ